MHFDAVIFDMDGVVTRTAAVHSSAWKRTFDEYLRYREAKLGHAFREFTSRDYLEFVDGRPRYMGVDSFLRSRGIDLPLGDPTDDPRAETVCGLGNRKNEVFNDVLKQDGVDLYPSTIQLIHKLRERGVKVGLATSSKNCDLVLDKAGIADVFETVVDGVVSERLGLKGKPEPDIFITACRNLRVVPERAAIVEDAVSGVQAGRKGRFGLVIGVARENDGDDLRRSGADLVVADLSEISVEQIDNCFKNGARTDGNTKTWAQESV